MQFPRGICVIHLAQDLIRQMDPVDTPSPLWRNVRRSIVKILIVGFQESIVDLVESVVEYLLRRIVAVRCRIGAEEDSVLILLKEGTRGPRLAAQFSGGSP